MFVSITDVPHRGSEREREMGNKGEISGKWSIFVNIDKSAQEDTQ